MLRFFQQCFAAREPNNRNQNEHEDESTVLIPVQTPAQKLLASETSPETGDLIEIIIKPTIHFVIYYGDGDVIDICSDTHGRQVRLEHLTKVAQKSEVRISDKTGIKLQIESELKTLLFPLPLFGKINDSNGIWLTEDRDTEEEPPQKTISPAAQERKTEWMTVTNLIKCKKPLPGDLIEFDRTTFSHFAMWYFNGYVFDIEANSKSVAAFITLEHIEKVADGSKVCISNKSGRKVHTSNTRAMSVDLAFQDLYTEVLYNVKTNNCEHYVTKWRYGQGWSDQIENLGFFKRCIMKITGLGSSIAPSTSSRPHYSKSLTNPKIRKSNEEVVKLVE